MSNLRYGRLSLLGSCVVGILAAAAASAQQATPPASAEKPAAPPAAASAQELEEIVVTGSRIMRASALESTIPVTSVAATELLQQGDINIGDALNDLPSLRSTYSQGNSTRFIGTAGLNFLDLRGLGVERTLVLVNGRRHITASPGDYLVDTNTIPSELIERVDVVTGGNSADLRFGRRGRRGELHHQAQLRRPLLPRPGRHLGARRPRLRVLLGHVRHELRRRQGQRGRRPRVRQHGRAVLQPA